MNKINSSKECIICYYWYFKEIGFIYEPYLCISCHGLMQKRLVLMILLFIMLKEVPTELTYDI